MTGKKLYVGNLSYSTTEGEVRELFSKHGTVEDVKVIPNKGFGFVEMSNPAEAEAAKTALNSSVFGGRTLKIDEARPMTDKPRRDNGNFGRF